MHLNQKTELEVVRKVMLGTEFFYLTTPEHCDIIIVMMKNHTYTGIAPFYTKQPNWLLLEACAEKDYGY